MPTPEIIVRAARTDDEIDALFRMSAAMFSGSPHPDTEARQWRAYFEGLPGARPDMLRGAFRGATYLGGYIHYERELRIGSARIRTGCIGDVATRPDYRRQGVASVLMHDALAYARTRGQGLLLLDGISGFYHRFGFVDVLDIDRHLVSRAAVLDTAPGDHTVRPATEDAATALLDMYERHYGSYVGSFGRTLERQRYFVRMRLATNPPLLALDPAGQVRGYLLMPWHAQHQYAQEVAADTWPAALALLRHHALLLEEQPDPPEDVIWPLPPGSRTFYHLAEHLYITSRCNHHPNEGWLARPADLRALVAALEPELRRRWLSSGAVWRGAVQLAIGEERFALELAPARLRLAGGAEGATATALTPQRFTQLAFGFRPLWWAGEQEGQHVPPEVWAPLEILFPPQAAWIAGSDAF